MRRLTIGAMCAAGIVSTIGFSGSRTPRTRAPTRAPPSRRLALGQAAADATPPTLASRRAHGLAAGDGGQDRQLGAVGDRRREPVQEADVFAGEVDVDEAPQRAVLVGDPLAQLAVALEQAVRTSCTVAPSTSASASPPAAARSCVGIFTTTPIRPRRPRATPASNASTRRRRSCASRTCRAPRRASSGPRR